MGEAPDNLPVPLLLNDNIWKYVNELQCTTTATENEFYKETVVQTFPNPASDMIVIASEQSIEKVEILNIHGQKLKAVTSSSKEISIPIGEMQKGIYIVQAKMTDGRRWTGRFVKQ
jgi:hypothetical protein